MFYQYFLAHTLWNKISFNLGAVFGALFAKLTNPVMKEYILVNNLCWNKVY